MKKARLLLYLWGKPVIRTVPLTHEEAVQRIANWREAYGWDVQIETIFVTP